ncbi:MAG: copper chaperone PCu(A)C [Hyphomonadaceae bacterium]
MKPALVLCFTLALCACGAGSPSPLDTSAGQLSIQDSWAAPTPSGAAVSAGYLTIDNTADADDRLLNATSPRAERIEIHEMTMDGAIMRMRSVEALDIAANAETKLAPGSVHLMFYNVAPPFDEGEQIPVQLTFETAGRIDVVLTVRRSAPEDHAGL